MVVWLITVGKLKDYPATVLKVKDSSTPFYKVVYKNQYGDDIEVGVMEDQMKEDWQI